MTTVLLTSCNDNVLVPYVEASKCSIGAPDTVVHHEGYTEHWWDCVCDGWYDGQDAAAFEYHYLDGDVARGRAWPCQEYPE